MKFPGYWVSACVDKVAMEKAAFDETELDPATNWKQAWQNQSGDSSVRGFVDLGTALISAATSLAKMEGRTLSQTDIEQVLRFEPVWRNDRCEIQSVSQLLGLSLD